MCAYVRACLQSDRFCDLACHLPQAHGRGLGPLCSWRAKSYQDCCTLHHMAANPCAFTQSIHTKHPIMSGSHMCCAMLCLPGAIGQNGERSVERDATDCILPCGPREAKLPWEEQGLTSPRTSILLVLAYKQGIHDGHRQDSFSTKHRTCTPLYVVNTFASIGDSAVKRAGEDES